MQQEQQVKEPTLRRVAPAVDIFEGAEGLHLVADLPGVSKEGVHLDVEKDVLTISAQFTPVEYYRAFALGEDLDAGRIAATMRDGVLELFLPKAERAKTKKIQIELG